MNKVRIDSKKISIGNYALVLNINGDIFFTKISNVEKLSQYQGKVYNITVGNFIYQIYADKDDRSSERVYKNSIIDIFKAEEMKEAELKINMYYKKIKEIKEAEKEAKNIYESIIQRKDLPIKEIEKSEEDKKISKLLNIAKEI